MPRVVIQPAGYAIEARHDETIMGAARRLGYYWPTTCGGQAICTTCVCLVEEGGEPRADGPQRTRRSPRGTRACRAVAAAAAGLPGARARRRDRAQARRVAAARDLIITSHALPAPIAFR